jgi:ubiquinone/menaquinone biosynthesis C-methylase UbiE
MDDVARYLEARWKALGDARAVYCRPWTDIDATTARSRLDPEHRLGDLEGKDVLCLAGGGGQQSVAFAVLGANVTVLDLDEAQLRRDREVADRRHLAIVTQRGDMRDLPFEAASFDVVWHVYSINFVPQIDRVIAGVARVLRPGGMYVFNTANPFAIGIGTHDWNGDGYVLRHPYVDGAVYEYRDEAWVADTSTEVLPPQDYLHSLGTIVRLLADEGFMLVRVDEETGPGDGVPGSWDHLRATIPPWLTFWSVLRGRN